MLLGREWSIKAVVFLGPIALEGHADVIIILTITIKESFLKFEICNSIYYFFQKIIPFCSLNLNKVLNINSLDWFPRSPQ